MSENRILRFACSWVDLFSTLNFACLELCLRGTTAVVYMAESSGVRIGERAHVFRREEGRARGRPRTEGEDDTGVLGKRRRYSTLRWGAVARESYQQAQRGSREARFERGEGGGVT